MHTVSIWRRWAALAMLALGVLLLSLVAGPAHKGLGDVWAALLGQADPVARTVILELRLPRALAAFGVGSALAVAGLLLQALFRNPLADPYVLGISGGAAIGALLAIVAGAGALALQSSAATGAALAIGAVWLLARGHEPARLLLTGVVIASGCGAVVALLLAVATSEQLRGMVFWLAGDLSHAHEPWPALVAAALACAFAGLFGRALNVLAAGELRARSVGLDTTRWRQAVLAAAALLTAVAVVSAGTIGFVGLVAPHLTRLLLRTTDHRRLAPAAALMGGTLVSVADLLARTLAEPRQLPVGGIIALVGAPLFLLLLRRTAR
jgi:iron complex transport system permease protein